LIIVRGRVERVAEAIRSLGIDAVDRVEQGDPQFKAVSLLVRNLRDPCLAGFLVLGNALISYRLSMAGEEYWMELSRVASEYFSSVSEPDPTGFFEWFLSRSRGNRLGREQKARRIRKLAVAIGVHGACSMCGKLGELRDRLASAMGSDPGAKTIVFAVKMYYYYCRALGVRVAVPFSIDIPVDSRISMLAATSGIIGGNDWREVWRRLYTRERRLASKAWRLVAEASGIPPLRLDALLWLPARAAREAGYVREKAVILAYRYLARYTGLSGSKLIRLCEELFHEMR
jgi:DNA-(apurinic or apyrimidinic site) lyase